MYLLSSKFKPKFKKKENVEMAPGDTSSSAAVAAIANGGAKKEAARFLIIGVGQRGNSFGRKIKDSTDGIVVGVAEIHDFKRERFAKMHRLPDDMVFKDWKELLADGVRERVRERVDGVIITVLDHMHAEIATALIPLGYHIMCEKPLATTYEDCIRIQQKVEEHNVLFAIGHVLRYSPHNLLLKRLICDEKIIGEVVAVQHTEPIGWWHMAHSFVRGSWHDEKTSAASIITKCCHDLDLLLWFLCSPNPNDPNDKSTAPHLPSSVYSTGELTHFRPSRKPANATSNCITCPAEKDCMYSAKKIYIENRSGLRGGFNTNWPVNVVFPEIEEGNYTLPQREQKLLKILENGPYGRCVYDGHNNVTDNQVVIINWKDNTVSGSSDVPVGRNAKTATLSMTAFSDSICERRTTFYGTKGELTSNTALPVANAHPSKNPHMEPHTSLRSISFEDPHAGWITHTPSHVDLFSGHGGGDTGLIKAFVEAVEKVKFEGWKVDKAQREVLKTGVDEAVRAHGLGWAAEESRKSGQALEWAKWDREQRTMAGVN